MASQLLTISVLGVTLLLLQGGAEAATKCDVKKFDTAIGDVIFLAGSHEFPTTKPQMDAYCVERGLKSLKVANDYVEGCVNGIAKGMMKLMMEGAAREINTKCTEGDPGREQYLKLADCLIPKAGRGMHRCNRKLAAIFEAAVGKAKKDRIPLSCCNMGEFYECVRKSASVCGKEAEVLTKNIVDNYAGDLMDTVCSTWRPGSAKCNRLPRLKPVARPKYKTLAPPLVEILASLAK